MNQIFFTKLIFHCWRLSLSLFSVKGKYKEEVKHSLPKHRELSSSSSTTFCLPADEEESSACTEFITSYRSDKFREQSLSQILSALLTQELTGIPRRADGARYLVKSCSDAATPLQTIVWVADIHLRFWTVNSQFVNRLISFCLLIYLIPACSQFLCFSTSVYRKTELLCMSALISRSKV